MRGGIDMEDNRFRPRGVGTKDAGKDFWNKNVNLSFPAAVGPGLCPAGKFLVRADLMSPNQ